MKQYLIVLFGVIANMVYSQNVSFEISGIITDINKEPLESATVYLQSPKDSTTVSYTISDKKGRFLLEGNTNHSKLHFFVSYLGYKTYYKEMLMDGKLKTLDTIVLEENTNELDEILIKSTAPVTIKKDTIEFHASAFKTRINANVEDLLKKFPGVEVTRDGAITVNGKPVDNIKVNGKPFFLSDPTLATRGLRSAVIEKVQVVDSRTEAEAFTGEPGSGETKTINLQIKEELSGQYFGDVGIAAGPNESYRFKGMLNYIKDKKQVAIAGNGNYANLETLGEDIPGFSTAQPLQTEHSHGANYSNELFKETDLGLGYGYNYGKNTNGNRKQREYILPESSYISKSANDNASRDNGLNGSVRLKFKPSESLFINIVQNHSVRKNNQHTATTELSQYLDGTTINQSMATRENNATNSNFNNMTSISKKFKRQGNYLNLLISSSNYTSQGESRFDSQVDVFGDNPYSEIRKQRIDKNQERVTLTTSVQYNQSISKSNKLSMSMGYVMSTNKNENKALAYDFNETIQDFDDFNTALSTNLVYKEQTHEPIWGIRYQDPESFRFSGSLRFTHKVLESDNQLIPVLSLKRSFNSINGDIRYSNSKPTRRKDLSFSRNTRVPSLDQVQPFLNVDNPLNTVIGNPELSPSFNNRLSASWTTLNLQKHSSLRLSFSGSIEEETIIPKTTVDDNLISTTTYVNVNGNYAVSINAGMSKKFNMGQQKELKLNLEVAPSSRRNINFSNDIRYKLTNTALTVSPKLMFNWKDILQLDAKYVVALTKSEFSLDSFKDTEFVSHRFYIDALATIDDRLEINSNLTYTYNPQIQASFNRSMWLWNADMSYTLFDNKAAVTLEIYDMLRQNNNATRTVTSNYIEDSQSSVLSQYAFLGFKWKF